MRGWAYLLSTRIPKLQTPNPKFQTPNLNAGEVFTDPVLCADGHTYERHHIEEWASLPLSPSRSLSLFISLSLSLCVCVSLSRSCSLMFFSLSSSREPPTIAALSSQSALQSIESISSHMLCLFSRFLINSLFLSLPHTAVRDFVNHP